MTRKMKLKPILFLFFLGLLSTGCQEHVQLVGQIAEGTQLVIISLGDSNASGEGNPDGSGSPQWLLNSEIDAVECHRSFTNAHRLAAVTIADEWPYGDENVIFRSFACTGATIWRGILGPHFAGPGGPLHPGELPLCTGSAQDPKYCTKSQLEVAQEWVQDPTSGVLGVDAVIISIGVNDVGFGHLVAACARPALSPLVDPLAPLYTQPCNENSMVTLMLESGCPISGSFLCNDTYSDPARPHILGMQGLPAALDQLLNEVKEKLDPKHILLVGYPNPSRDQIGNFCHRWDDGFIVGTDSSGALQPGGTTAFGIAWPIGAASKEIEFSESRWAYEQVVLRLNEILSNRAQANGVIYVDDVPELTRERGFCATPRWFLTFQDSFQVQQDFQGTLHPNAAGHQAISGLIADTLREVLAITSED
jgi:lysophospholipase L1-like esterase